LAGQQTRSKMKFFLIQFQNGNQIKTAFNGNLDTAKKYYLGQYFVLDETDKPVKVTAVTEI
jgi:hypothetical protein